MNDCLVGEVHTCNGLRFAMQNASLILPLRILNRETHIKYWSVTGAVV